MNIESTLNVNSLCVILQTVLFQMITARLLAMLSLVLV
jgi:hypothetical protein